MEPAALPPASSAATADSVTQALSKARPLLVGGRLLVASDFDGTLSRLVTDPWGARIIPAAQRALRALAVAPATHVALISGRTVADLADRARIGGISYRGDHGAERAEAARGFRPAALQATHEPTTAPELQMSARLAREVSAAVPQPWLIVERKHAAVTLHFRAAPDIEEARRLITAAVEAIDERGLLSQSGSGRAIELRPASASTKGDALGSLIDQYRPSAVIMLGDDRNDALAFDVLRARRAAGNIDGLAVAVAGRADVTADVGPRADMLLSGPVAVARLLTGLERSRV